MTTAPGGPLCGVRVLDLGHTVMGPTAGLVLADMGAEVVHVEPPAGDRTRRLEGFGRGFFAYYNRNKKSFAVDLKTGEGRAAFLALVDTADVLLENFAPGTMDRLGVGWQTLHERNPRLVYLALKGFLRGPYADRAALDEVAQMMGGLAYMTGPPGRPMRAGASVVDNLGGVFGALGVVAALRERERTGEGQLVRSSLFESVVFLMGQFMAYAALERGPVPPMSARHQAWAIYEVFDTADEEQIFFGITSDRHWQAFCRAFERPDLAADASLASNNQRIAARERLGPLVAAILATRTAAEIERLAVEHKLPFAPVAKPEDLFAHPHLTAGGHLLETRLEPEVRAALPALPLEVGDWAAVKYADPPAIGAHTRELLAELGYDAATIAALVEKRVVHVAGDDTSGAAR
jgi:crotonobetainyl-CoA:carnitine CoA-transferase CaiB-like acyl-CoA transferase